MNDFEQKMEDHFCMHGGQDEYIEAQQIVDQTLKAVFRITVDELLEARDARRNQPLAKLEFVKDFRQRFPQCKKTAGKEIQTAYVLFLFSENNGWEFSKAWVVSEGKIPISMMNEIYQLINLDYRIICK